MVICTYFLNNSCRFGKECINDHVDLKTLIKQEVQSAQNQWPLSCFGPFKEKPCLQNFIDDQSFEEVRYYCYEAKTAGTLQQFAQQLADQIKDAKNKIHSLQIMTPEILQEIIKIYNSGPEANTPAVTTTASSIFGGSSAAPSNPFMGPASVGTNNAASIFGGAAQQTTFGNAATGTTSMFGQSQQPSAAFGQAKPSIFGQSSFSSQPQTGGSIFGGTSTTQQTSVFGGAPSFAQTPASSIFGGVSQQAPSAGSMFGAAPTQAPFGAGSTQQTSFGSNVQQNTFGGNTSSIYSGTQAPPANIFNATPTVPANQFGQQPAASIFGTAPQQTGYAATTQTPFGVQQSQQQQQPPPPAFGSSSGSMFTAAPIVQPSFSSQQSTSNMGQLSAPTQPLMQPPPPPPPSNESTIYSKTESLTKEQLDAFQADQFILGQIPSMPPPRELCL